MRRALAFGVGLALGASLLASRAGATAADVFGMGARSSGLASSDVADAEPAMSAFVNPAFAAKEGVRIQLGYGYSAMRLSVDGERAPVRDVSGIDAGVQIGRKVGPLTLGGAFALHMPDGYLLRIGYRPATEPQFVLYESSLQRMSVDAVVAASYGPVALGVGGAIVADAAGNGVDFALGQDAKGTYADGSSDIVLPYHAAPIAGLSVDLGRAMLAARFRGALAVDLALDTRATIALQSNPLNGLTNVTVRGISGYDPATVDVATRIDVVPGVRALFALEYARYSAAPSPAADITLDLHLGTVPGELDAKFVAPRLRDTLSPRLGVDVRPGGPDSPWNVTAGWAFAPSPVPTQTGWTSYADAPRHAMALGFGYGFGRVWGVELAARAAGQWHLFGTRAEDKPNEALPHAHYTSTGHILHGALALEGAWK